MFLVLCLFLWLLHHPAPHRLPLLSLLSFFSQRCFNQTPCPECNSSGEVGISSFPRWPCGCRAWGDKGGVVEG